MKRWSCLFMLFVHKAQKLLLLCFFLGGGEGGGGGDLLGSVLWVLSWVLVFFKRVLPKFVLFNFFNNKQNLLVVFWK